MCGVTEIVNGVVSPGNALFGPVTRTSTAAFATVMAFVVAMGSKLASPLYVAVMDFVPGLRKGNPSGSVKFAAERDHGGREAGGRDAHRSGGLRPCAGHRSGQRVRGAVGRVARGDRDHGSRGVDCDGRVAGVVWGVVGVLTVVVGDQRVRADGEREAAARVVAGAADAVVGGQRRRRPRGSRALPLAGPTTPLTFPLTVMGVPTVMVVPEGLIVTVGVASFTVRLGDVVASAGS